MIKVAKSGYAVPISVIAILVVPFFVMPSFLALITYLLIAVLADIAFRPKSEVLSSLLLPIVSSGTAFTLNTLNLDFTSKKLQACTLVALIALLFMNNKIYARKPDNQNLDLANFLKFSILPVGVCFGS